MDAERTLSSSMSIATEKRSSLLSVAMVPPETYTRRFDWRSRPFDDPSFEKSRCSRKSRPTTSVLSVGTPTFVY